jgi:hypothetical protein
LTHLGHLLLKNGSGPIRASSTNIERWGRFLWHRSEDLRELPSHLRKNNLARLFARRVDGIFLSDFEQGEIAPTYSATPA